MQRIDGANAAAGQKYQDANPGTGQLATSFTAAAMTALQEEICSVVEGSGAALDSTKFDQLKRAIFELSWPVGAVYIDHIGTQNPQQILGYGNWTEICIGRVPVGLDASQVEFNAIGKQGGEKTHVLATTEMPPHVHTIGSRDSTANEGGSNLQEFVSNDNYAGANVGPKATTSTVGGGLPHNNLQPYEVVGRVWYRSA